jgi:Uma2 family endonuclease
MFPFKYPVPQTDPPRSPRETLPTMYDLPSEYPEDPGLPDEFHHLQPQLLSQTFRPANTPPTQIFCGSDLNLYYDSRHPFWYKRPDWFGVVGVPRLYDDVDLRLSYVVWQEGINPFVVVELLSPGTEKEDLGEREMGEDSPTEGNGHAPGLPKERPPRKWDVYEHILRIPYYVVFSRYTHQWRVFRLQGNRYQELELPESRLWVDELKIGLGLWQGEYLGIDRLWLRWYDDRGNWIPTEAQEAQQQAQEAQQQAQEAQQQAQQERDRAAAAETELESLKQRLREAGIDPNAFLG